MIAICYNNLRSKRKAVGVSLKNKKLKIARMEKDMNQQQLADTVGVTRQTIVMIESGNYNPTLNLCISICKALGKTLDELFWTEETEEDSNEQKKA